MFTLNVDDLAYIQIDFERRISNSKSSKASYFYLKNHGISLTDKLINPNDCGVFKDDE